VLERLFHFTRRIQAEEETLRHVARVVASTRQEVLEQYGLYGQFDPRRAVVIPPGTDTARFAPPRERRPEPGVAARVDRFLAHPRRPVLLSIGRPVPSKNLLGLVRAYGSDPVLRARANLVLLAGSHEDVRELDEEGRATWEELFRTLDRLDLFGSVAFPKSHQPSEVPDLYRLAVLRRGVYVNPAFAESFGLTLIEAAASGLPLVTTDSGGPRDIVANCRNGLVVPPGDEPALAAALREALGDPQQWAAWSRNGLRGVRDHYTWDAHVRRYLKVAGLIIRRDRKRRRRELVSVSSGREAPLLQAQGVLVCDLDDTLLGDREALARLLEWIGAQRDVLAFGVATGRKLDSALYVLKEWGVPAPDVIISGIGTEIRYRFNDTLDLGWHNHIRQGWRRDDLAAALREVPGLTLQSRRKQGPLKLSYNVKPARLPSLEAIQEVIHRAGLQANLVYSRARHLDVLPQRASKGQAVRYLAFKWGIPPDRIITAGDSGNDRDMLLGDMLGIVVGNHSPELGGLRGRARVFFANQPRAAGILEGLRHYALRYGFPDVDRLAGLP
jgi:sucrose-phosphate synthase